MDQKTSIKEISGTLHNNPSMLEMVKNWVGIYWDDHFMHVYWHVSYIEQNEQKDVITCSYLGDKKDINLTFKEYVQLADHTDIHSLLLITSTYFPTDELNKLKTVINRPFDKNPNNPLNMLFHTTNGYIIYDYQIEHLYQLVSNAWQTEAIQFRKNYNKQKRRELNKILDYRLFGQSFFEILDQRCFFNIGILPNFRGTKILYEFFNNIS
jgi:hypothetical protein